MFEGKQIVLGVCGGIAAYKAPELVRLYVKDGAQVHVVMTRSAQEFITPLTFQTLTGNPVHTDLFNLYQEKEIGHIALAERAELVVVAPATANLLGKMAAGIADDLLTTTLLATKAPVLLAPAMNVNMWDHPVTRRNLAQVREDGCRVLEPETGFLACGWEGKGKLPEPATIFQASIGMLVPQDLAGQAVLVTAGPTREAIDPVRFLTNHSSGKMGYAVARAAAQRGAKVRLVSGPTCLDPPSGVEVIPVDSAEEMRRTCLDAWEQTDILIKAAAVADYRPVRVAGDKLKKEREENLNLVLERTVDILGELGSKKGHRILVGFAAETRDLVENARKKLGKKNLDMIVANDVTREGAGFGGDTNIVRLLFADGREEDLPCLAKDVLAHRLLDRIAALIQRNG